MRKAGLCCLLLLAVSALSGQAVDPQSIVRSQQELTAEGELAKEPHFYFVLDILGKNLELRVKGMVLRGWKLESMRFWGKPAFSKTVQLVKKTTLKPPQRNVIVPGEAAVTSKDPGKFELEALELKDMPRSFSLDFDSGLQVSVRASQKGLKAMVQEARWYAWLPIRNYFSARSGKPLSVLEIKFENEKDAQAIYWIFFEGIKGLVY